jgi:transposase InsO family protein
MNPRSLNATKVFAAAGGAPRVPRMDNGPELGSHALQRFCDGKVGLTYIPPGCPWDSGYIESFNNRLRKECLNRNHWNTMRRDQRLQRRAQPIPPPLSARLPHASRVGCSLQVHPHTRGLQDQLNLNQTKPDSKTTLKPA